MQVRSVRPIDRTIRVDLGVMAIKGVLCIPQSSSITGTAPLLFTVISRILIGVGVLPLCRDAVSVFYSPIDWTIHRVKYKNSFFSDNSMYLASALSFQIIQFSIDKQFKCKTKTV